MFFMDLDQLSVFQTESIDPLGMMGEGDPALEAVAAVAAVAVVAVVAVVVVAVAPVAAAWTRHARETVPRAARAFPLSGAPLTAPATNLTGCWACRAPPTPGSGPLPTRTVREVGSQQNARRNRGIQSDAGPA